MIVGGSLSIGRALAEKAVPMAGVWSFAHIPLVRSSTGLINTKAAGRDLDGARRVVVADTGAPAELPPRTMRVLSAPEARAWWRTHVPAAWAWAKPARAVPPSRHR